MSRCRDVGRRLQWMNFHVDLLLLLLSQLQYYCVLLVRYARTPATYHSTVELMVLCGIVLVRSS